MDPKAMQELASSMEGMSKEEIESLIKQQKERFDEEGEQERARERDPLAPGRWVIVEGLQAAAELNGKSFEIVQAKNSSGRFGVRTHTGDKLVKEANLRPFPQDAVTKVARVGARGEEIAPKGPGGVRTWHWPLRVLEELPCEASPFSELIGVPLNVTRVEPHKAKLEGEALDNFFGREFMVSPDTLLAPLPWQVAQGPVIVWRPGGAPFSADDACLVHGFISDLVSGGLDGKGRAAITPELFREYKRAKLEKEKQVPWGEQSEDVNI